MATFWFYKSGKLEASRKGFYFQGTQIYNKLPFLAYTNYWTILKILAQDWRSYSLSIGVRLLPAL